MGEVFRGAEKTKIELIAAMPWTLKRMWQLPRDLNRFLRNISIEFKTIRRLPFFCMSIILDHMKA